MFVYKSLVQQTKMHQKQLKIGVTGSLHGTKMFTHDYRHPFSSRSSAPNRGETNIFHDSFLGIIMAECGLKALNKNADENEMYCCILITKQTWYLSMSSTGTG